MSRRVTVTLGINLKLTKKITFDVDETPYVEEKWYGEDVNYKKLEEDSRFKAIDLVMNNKRVMARKGVFLHAAMSNIGHWRIAECQGPYWVESNLGIGKKVFNF
ncbi:MAG: hypothetical protein AMS21_01010 [Gemmatimonas sp. SG8_38_2]|nr:MAG: hypothetical protein AMS21_01010 [Gemmatimonas sp. SG8_38_2]